MHPHVKRSAFTLIELLIVIAVLGILSVLALTTYSRATANSRDSRRKTDVGTYKAALEKYQLTSGKFAVAKSGLNENGYGEVGKAYTGFQSIASRLQSEGYISTVALDPFVRSSGSAKRDYVVLLCNAKGDFITDGLATDLFGVWAKLEQAASVADQENAKKYCGGTKAWPYGIGGVPGPFTEFASATLYFAAAPGTVQSGTVQ